MSDFMVKAVFWVAYAASAIGILVIAYHLNAPWWHKDAGSALLCALLYATVPGALITNIVDTLFTKIQKLVSKEKNK